MKKKKDDRLKMYRVTTKNGTFYKKGHAFLVGEKDIQIILEDDILMGEETIAAYREWDAIEVVEDTLVTTLSSHS